MDTNTQARVVRVTRTEFELSDGRVYEHPVPLDYDPTIENFQQIYDFWKDAIEHYGEEQARRQTGRTDRSR